MNKIFALEETVRIWKKLAETGTDEKESVFGAEKYAKCCPCCHYVLLKMRQRGGMFDSQCKICPAKLVWSHKPYGIFCTNHNSSYYRWRASATVEQRKHFASLLYKGVEEVLSMEYLKEMNQ